MGIHYTSHGECIFTTESSRRNGKAYVPLSSHLPPPTLWVHINCFSISYLFLLEIPALNSA